MTIAVYLCALGAVAVGTVVQAAVGFGLGMIAAPILGLLDPTLVPGPVLFLAVLLTAWIAWKERSHLDWHGVRWALVGRVAGTVVAIVLFARLVGDGITLVLGVLIIGAVLLSVSGWALSPTRPALLGAGTLSGLMGTLTSVGGPPMALVYQCEEAARLRSTLAGFFFFGATLSMVALVGAGGFGGSELTDGIMLVPGLALGLVAGRPAQSFLDRGWTRPAVLGLSAVASCALIVESLV